MCARPSESHLCLIKAWLLAPPHFPQAVLREARLTLPGDAQGGSLACALFRRDAAAIGAAAAAAAVTGGHDGPPRLSPLLSSLAMCELREGETLVVPGSSALSNWWHGSPAG